MDNEYLNPIMESYECDGQISIFDMFSDCDVNTDAIPTGNDDAN